MTQLVLGAVGAYVGFLVGGPTGAQVGFALGSAVGGYIAAPDTQGPRLTDLSVQISSYGAGIPKVYGGDRVAVNVIWARPLQEVESTTSAKGGPEVTEYTYLATFAVLVGEGYIESIRKIWFDAKLVYDISVDADAGTQAASAALRDNFVFYKGTEDQLPDPTIESFEGVGNVEAYRGSAYIVFTGLDVAAFGNRIPQVRVETTTEIPEVLTTNVFAALEIRPWESTFGGMPSHSGGGETEYYNVGNETGWEDEGPGPYTTLAAAVANLGDQNVYNSYFVSDTNVGESVRTTLAYFAEGDPPAPQTAADYLGTTNGPWFAIGAYNFEYPDRIIYNGFTYVIPLCSEMAFDGVQPNEDPQLSRAFTTGPVIGIGGHAGLIRFQPGPNPSNLPGYGTFFNNNCTNYPAEGGIFPVASMSPNALIRAQRIPSVPIRACFPGNPAVDGIAELPGDPDFCISADGEISPNYTYTKVAGTFRQLRTLPQLISIYSADPAWLPRGPVLPSTDPNYNNQAWWDEQATLAGIDIGSETYGMTYGVVVTEAAAALSDYEQVEEGTALLSDIVSDICLEAGLAAEQFDVTELTDTVLGYTRTRMMPGISAIQPLRQAYYFDATEVDGVLKFVKRGGAPALTIDTDDLGAGLETASPDVVAAERAQLTDLPNLLAVAYKSRAADYQTATQVAKRSTEGSVQQLGVELPIVLSDQKAAEIAQVLLYESYVMRSKRTFTIPLPYSRATPTDILSVQDDEFSYRVRVVSKIEEGPVLRIEAVDDDPSQYSPDAVPGAVSGGGATVDFVGPANLILLDTPIFQDSDDNPGFYAAATTFGTMFRAARIFRSLDAGVNYSNLDEVLRESSIGTCTALGDFDGGNVVDTVNTMTVTLQRGTLASITRAQLLNNGNVAVLGNGEVIQFQTATFVAERTYILSNLLRGRLGTERFMGNHVADEQFVLISPASTVRVDDQITNIGVEGLYRGVTLGSTLDASFEQTFTNTAEGLKPLSPVHLEAVAQGTSPEQYAVTWVRRSRLAALLRDFVDTPLGETTESYRVEVIRSGAVVSTVDVSVAEALVYAETGDTIRVRQLSSSVGPGNPATLVL